MSLPTDISIKEFFLEFIPVQTRVPLKFGSEVLSSVTCARVSVKVGTRAGAMAYGWGETPLSVQWVWPSGIGYSERHQALMDFTSLLVKRWDHFDDWGHCLELGSRMIMEDLPVALSEYNGTERTGAEPIPWLAALVCASAFDLAVHDAYGVVNKVPTYRTYGREFLSSDLACFLEPAQDSSFNFESKFPADFLVCAPPSRIPVWHLVGGLDPLDESNLNGDEPDDGYPVHLREWIEKDGLNCLKIKLRGNDSIWDYQRLLSIGEISHEMSVDHLTADFNCTVTDPNYVIEILDRLKREVPRLTIEFYMSSNLFPMTWKEIRLMCTKFHLGSPYLWTKAPMTGNMSGREGNLGGMA